MPVPPNRKPPGKPPNDLSFRWMGLNLKGSGTHGSWGVVIIIVAILGFVVFAPQAVATVLAAWH